jgi:hypothetical protein
MCMDALLVLVNASGGSGNVRFRESSGEATLRAGSLGYLHIYPSVLQGV